MQVGYHSFLEVTSTGFKRNVAVFAWSWICVWYEVLISVNLRVNVMTTFTHKSHGNMIPNYVLTPRLVVQIDMCICSQLFC